MKIDSDTVGGTERGHRLEDDQFIEASKEELEEIALESTHTIEIDAFVDRAEIDPRYPIRPYYLRPDGKVGHDAFAAIRKTIREMGKIAIGRGSWFGFPRHHRPRGQGADAGRIRPDSHSAPRITINLMAMTGLRWLLPQRVVPFRTARLRPISIRLV